MFNALPRRIVAALLASLAVAGCTTAAPPAASQPTAAPTQAVAAQPTAAPTQAAAAQPTAAPAQPTAAPAQPTVEPPAQAPDRLAALNIGTVARRYLQAEFPGHPIVAGALAVAGDYAVATAVPAGFEWRLLFMRVAPGAGYEVVLDNIAATSEKLRARGIPTSLLQRGEAATVASAVMFHTNTPQYGGADGVVTVDGVDGGYARATLHRAPGDELTIYLAQVEGNWRWLIDGQLFALEALDAHGIPASLR